MTRLIEAKSTCRSLCLVCLTLATLTGCTARTDNSLPKGDQLSGKVWFREIAKTSGLDFVHRSGHDSIRYLLPEIVCGAAALFDMDQDGDLDVYLVQSGQLAASSTPDLGNQLFRNDGSGQFVDVTEASGADDQGYGMGVASGDYDNDGDPDIYVTNYGPNTLLRNDGNGKFTDVTATAGVGDDGLGSSAAFLDFDRDGDLDIVTLNYVRWSVETELPCRTKRGFDYCSPKMYEAPAPDRLYKNNGDGSFSDVSGAAGLESSYGNGLGVVCSDFNGDDWIDIFVANDGTDDQLWINQQDGTFEDQASWRGVAVDRSGLAKAGMGVDAFDYDADGDQDLLVVNLRNETDSFLTNEGSFFSDQTVRVGLGHVSRPMTRFGVAMVDFNNDGLADLFEATGKVMRYGEVYGDDPYAEPNILLVGLPDGRLQLVTPAGGTQPVLYATSRAAAFGDVDNDGRVDVVVANRDGPVHLLHNVTSGPGHWVSFQVLNRHGADAIGAKLQLTAGERSIFREVRTAYSYCAAHDPRVNIGLGPATSVDQLKVTWPDGTQKQVGPFDEVDRAYIIKPDD